MTRKVHVKRLYGNDKNGNPDPTSSVWIDVARIDEINSFHAFSLNQAQGIFHIYKWQDDQGEDQIPTRITHKIPIYDPTNPPNDDPQAGDEDTVTLYLVEQIQQTKYGEPDGQSWRLYRTFKNDPDKPTQRKFTVVQVQNNDFGGSNNDPFAGRDINFIMNWDDYQQLLPKGANDPDQYIYEEFIDEYKVFEHGNIDTDSNNAGASLAGQIIYIVLLNKEVMDQNPNLTNFTVRGTNYNSLRVLDPNNAGPSLPYPPVRVDPLQMIVNVSWGGIAVEFGDKDQPPPPP